MILDKISPVKLVRNRRLRSRSKKRNKLIDHLRLVAITGSAGKTTTGHVLHHILAHSGIHTGFMSTSGAWLNDQLIDPDFVLNVATSQEFNDTLLLLASKGAQVVIMEAPASAIVQRRFFGMQFDSLILTNIGGGDFARDFASEQEYAETIFSLLHQVEEEGMAVLNADDDASQWIAQNAAAIKQNIYAAWTSKEEAENLEISGAGTRFQFGGGYFDTKTISRLYLENMLQAIKLATKYVGLDAIDAALNSYHGLAGREQVIKTQPYTIVVDYAYQPIVIDMLLEDIKQTVPPGHKLITILGAAGQRGDGRKQVGIPAVKYSDIVLLTPQDPRGEDVMSINTKIAKFTEEFGGVLVDRFIDVQEYEAQPKQNLNDKIARVILNGDVPIISFDANSPVGRYNAIDYAIEVATPGDVILILGKGDDDVMDFGDTLYEWSDAEAVKDILDRKVITEVRPGIGSPIE